ncbi:MAG TPA: restriction endonuclease PLD domain-containing protein [Gemmatimonadaceae bacterium]|jgi:hypothetical protein
MIISELYSRALIEPADAADRLYAVSGYASAAFARRHIKDLLDKGRVTEVNLIVGMPGQRNDHVAFKELHAEFAGKFKGYYYNRTPPVHSKVYGWYNGDKDVSGFAGSANYSQYGFFENQQRNQLSIEDPKLIKTLFDSLLADSIYIPLVVIEPPPGHPREGEEGVVQPGGLLWEVPDTRVRISFLSKDGTLPQVSGLNWGQRLERRVLPDGTETFLQREKNQTYLSLKGDSRKDGFLPPRAIRFTLVTDDGKSFDCVRAQDGDKAIHTTDDNSILGRYLRSRLGVPDGGVVTKEDLVRYGRTDFTIEKLDDETFLLDLSVKH